MSETLKEKLINYEEIPPADSWVKIAAALDQELVTGFPQKMYHHEVAPPPEAWEKIAEHLESESSQEFPTRLYNLEVEPPKTNWDKIAASLDTPSLAEKDRKPAARVRTLARLAIAACLLGAVAFAAIRLLNRPVGQPVAGTVTVPQKDSSQPTNDQSVMVQPQAQALSNNLPSPSSSIARTAVIPRKKYSPQQAVYMTQSLSSLSTGEILPSARKFEQAVYKGEVPGNCSVISESDPYLSFMNPDGYLIRISKKLAEALGCALKAGREDENAPCEDQIGKWREKIAQSAMSSSSDNFMNILDIIRIGEE